MTLEEQLAEVRKKTGRLTYMPESTQEFTQRALEGAEQRPALPTNRIPSASVMDAPVGFEGLKSYDPTRLARRGATYLWSGEQGTAAFDDAEYARTGKITRGMDARQKLEDLRNLSNSKPLKSVISGVATGAEAKSVPDMTPYSRTDGAPQAGQANMEAQARNSAVARGTGIFLDGGRREWDRPGEEEGPQAVGTQGLRPGEVRIGDFQGTVEEYMARRDALTATDQSRFARNAESFRGALGGPAGAGATEEDRRKAVVAAMPEGPEKQDALAEMRDEATARSRAGLKPSDMSANRGSLGSPDEKARDKRMAAYERNLDKLREGRLITKREANTMLREENEKEERNQKFQVDMATAMTRLEDAKNAGLSNKVDELQGKIIDINTQSAAWNKEENARLGLADGWDKEFIKIRNGLQAKHQKDAKYTKALNEMPVESRQEFMRIYTGMSAIKDKDSALQAALLAVMLPEPTA